ncbi:MAG: ribbon-helix-helix domain-containing protein [Actinomycetota bacterium]|nr:ribbon-helix-helix domain-containing protein [Actinomycetota bacterium]
MIKTSVYLTERERQRLTQLVRSTRRSQSELIREAIAAYDPAPLHDDDFTLAAVVDGPEESVADLPERELLAGFGEA